jgi:hypothetical protein
VKLESIIPSKGVAPETTKTARKELNEAGMEYMVAVEVKQALKGN